jgi:hypothetical protein
VFNIFSNPLVANSVGRAGVAQAQQTPAAAAAPGGMLGLDPMAWLMISGALANGARGGGWGEAAQGIAGALQMNKQQKEEEGRSDAQKRALVAFQMGDMKGAMRILSTAKGLEGEALDMAANLEGREYEQGQRKYWWEQEGNREATTYKRNRGDQVADRTEQRGWDLADMNTSRGHQVEDREDNQAHAAGMQRGEQGFRKSLFDLEQNGAGLPEFGDENGLRNQYLSQSKPFIDVRDAYGRIQKIEEYARTNGKPSPASDISLVFNFMKMNDPGSTVREGEYATAQNATGVPGQIRNAYNRALTGQGLNDEMRSDFVATARQLYDAQAESWGATFDQYQGLAQRYRMDPTIIQDFRLAPPSGGGGQEQPIPEGLTQDVAQILNERELEAWPELSPEVRQQVLDRARTRAKPFNWQREYGG